MTITALPTAPSRSSNPATFSDDADAFVGALALFRTEANALAVDANDDAAICSASAITAAADAIIAANAAASATTNATTQATSVSTMSIGSGLKAFDLAQTGKALVVGQWVAITSTASPSVNWMLGAITAFNSGTGAITVDVAQIGGSGSISSWTITAAAPVSIMRGSAAIKSYSFTNFGGF